MSEENKIETKILQLQSKMSFTSKMFFPSKYLIIFLVKENLTLRYIFSKEIKEIDYWLKHKGKQYIIDVENPSYVRDNTKIYFVDALTNSQFSFLETKSLITPEKLDNLIGGKLIEKLTRGVMNLTKEKIMYFIIGGVIGCLLGLLIMSFIKQTKIDELYEELRKSNPIILDWIIGLRFV